MDKEAVNLLLEMRLSMSPATPFSDASLPNHTKMFELVHVVTSMDDFDSNQGRPTLTESTLSLLCSPTHY